MLELLQGSRICVTLIARCSRQPSERLEPRPAPAPAAILGLADLAVLATGLKSHGHLAPFAGATLVFLSGYLGLADDFFAYLPP